MLRVQIPALFLFAPPSEAVHDKSGSTHQAIAAAGVTLAQTVFDHLSDTPARDAAIQAIADGVRHAQQAIVEEGPNRPPMTIGAEIKAATEAVEAKVGEVLDGVQAPTER